MSQRSKQKHATYRISIALFFAMTLLVMGGIGATKQPVIAADGVDIGISLDSDFEGAATINQGDLRGLRGLAAEDGEKPTFTVTSFSDGQSAGSQSLSLSILPQNFGTEDSHTVWCVDKVPVTQLGAGSEDRFVRKNGKRTLTNDYGSIVIPENGYDVCSTEALNTLGGFALSGREGGRLGDKQTRGIPAEPILVNTQAKPEHPPLSADHWWDMLRVPNIDTDHDGLDDEWEVRYFAGRVRPPSSDADRNSSIQDRIYPVDRAAILRLIRPQDDPDKDGWAWTYNYGEFPLTYTQVGTRRGTVQGSNIETNIPTISTVVSSDPYAFPWQLGIPGVFIPQERRQAGTSGYGDAATVDLGKWDGSHQATGCTNLIEYTFGTDPLNGDTDNDTIADCLDIAGAKQTQVSVPIDKKAGDAYTIEVHAFTGNSQWRTAQIESFGATTQPQKPGDVTQTVDAIFPPSPGRYQKLQENKYVRIDFRDRFEISQTQGLDLQLALEPAVVTTKTTGRLGQERIRVEAVPITRNVDISTLDYSWFLNGQHQEKASGVGKRFFFFNVDDPLPSGRLISACQKHFVTVNVIDPRTESTANSRIVIDVDPPIEFVKEVVGHVNRSPEGVQIESNYDASADSTDVRQGARNGDIVQFQANLLGVATSKAAADRGDESEKACGEKGVTLDQLIYKWSLDGTVDQEQTGKGTKFATAKFEIQKQGLTSPQQLTSSFENTTGTGHIVTLEVFAPDGHLLTATDERMNAVTPTVELSVQGESLEVNSKAAQEVLSLAADVDYLVKEGDTVTVKAKQAFFAPGSDVTFTAKRNGDDIDLGDKQELTFKVGKAGTIEVISMDAASPSGDHGGSSLQLRVVTENELKSVLERRSLIGALVEFIPPALRDSLRLVLGGGIFAAVLLLGLMIASPRAKAASAVQRPPTVS